MTADTITAIKKALEGVTPGPWVTYEGSLGYKGDVFAPTSKSVNDCHHIARCFAPRPEQSPLCDLQSIKVVDDAVAAVEANTIYIASVNPTAISELLSTLESLQRENEDMRNLADRLKLEAQGHAMEARVANSTISEIYQIISGGKGEPGNWHGAEPVRQYVQVAKGEILRLETELALSKPVYSRRQLEARAEAAEADAKRYREALHIISAGHACPMALAGNALRPQALASTGGEHHADK